MGLLRGIARTAVVAGTATHVSNNVSRRQARRYAAKDQAEAEGQATMAPEEPEAPDVNDQMAQLEQLGKLRDSGVLTEGEFTAKKQQILGL